MPHHAEGAESEKGKREAAVSQDIIRAALEKELAGDTEGAGKEIASLAPATPNGIQKKHPAFVKKAMKKLEEEKGVSFESIGRKAMLLPKDTLQAASDLLHSEDEEKKLAMVALEYGLYRAAIAATAKAKSAPQQNVQVNVDRRGIAVNGMRAVSSAPSPEPDPPKASPTMRYFQKPPETASKSPLDQEEA